MSKIVEVKAKNINTSILKLIGLIFEKTIYPVYFETRFGLHTIFMQKAIDVLILDDKNIVSQLKTYLKPNRLFIWNIKYKRVLELPAGFIEKSGIELGDSINLRMSLTL
jgi:uncharacterized membrane protein (UPF0127 family)